MSEERTDFLSNVLVTAVEGGINYWADVKNYQWNETTDRRRLTTASAEVKELTPNDLLPDWTPLTLDTIRQGIKNVKANSFIVSPTVLGWILTGDRNNDAGEIDAVAADCIVQAALFGKLVYG